MVWSSSPQVTSMSTSMSKKSSEIPAEPCARHGVGPSTSSRMRRPQTPTPNTFTENDAEKLTMK